MPMTKLNPVFGAMFYLVSSFCLAAEIPATSEYVSISIDKVVVDTNGLTRVTTRLSNSIENLSDSIAQLSNSETTFSEKDRQALIDATTSLDSASQALTRLSQQLPAAIQGFTRELPEALKNTQPQIAAISKSIHNASQAAIRINESFPESLARGKRIVSEITTDVMQNVTLYIGLVLLLFALVIGLLFYIFYKTGIQPIASGLSDLRVVPQQLSEMSAYMHDTSKNLLILEQQRNTRKRRSAIRRL